MYSGYSHTACRLWAERPPYEESLIIVRGRLGCITYYARDYARDYARPPTAEFATFLKKERFQYYVRCSCLRNLKCAGLCAGLCAPYDRGLGCILRKSSNILCESNGMSIAWMPIDRKNNNIHDKSHGICSVCILLQCTNKIIHCENNNTCIAWMLIHKKLLKNIDTCIASMPILT